MTDAPSKRPWLQFSLATAIVMMFAAGGVMYLNTLPLWHFDGKENGQEMFEIGGYGWPCVVYDTGMFYGPLRPPSWNWSGPACNAVFMALVAAYVGMLCEWRSLAPWLRRGLVLSTLLGLLLGGLLFWWLSVVSTFPAATPVSFEIGLKPGWQNWRAGAVVFVVVVLLALMAFALRAHRAATLRQGDG